MVRDREYSSILPVGLDLRHCWVQPARRWFREGLQQGQDAVSSREMIMHKMVWLCFVLHLLDYSHDSRYVFTQPVMGIVIKSDVYALFSDFLTVVALNSFEGYIFSFSIISQHGDDTGSWNPSSWKTGTSLSLHSEYNGRRWPGEERNQGIMGRSSNF